MDFKTFLKGIAVFKATFQNSKVDFDDDKVLEVWFRALKDIPDDIFNCTVEYIVKSFKFFPAIAEIRENAGKFTNGIERTAEDAWEEFIDALHSNGYYRPPVFSDPILEKVKSCIGWTNFCLSEESQMPIIRAQFLKLYESFRQKQEEITNLKEIAQHHGVSLPIGSVLDKYLKVKKKNILPEANNV